MTSAVLLTVMTALSLWRFLREPAVARDRRRPQAGEGEDAPEPVGSVSGTPRCRPRRGNPYGAAVPEAARTAPESAEIGFSNRESGLANPSNRTLAAVQGAPPADTECRHGFQHVEHSSHRRIDPVHDGEARIARLFELTSDLLATISPDGRFTLLNPAWEQLLGWTREELQAGPMHEFMHPEDVEETLAADASAAASAPARSRASPTAIAIATARGAGCCGARAATATPGTRRSRT